MSELQRARSLVTDKEVQGTNDDAQTSKLSCVKAGYFKDDYVQYFVKAPSRRSPLINRGYFSRCYALRSLVDLFLDRFIHPSGGHCCQIISLGAGFDSTWFCLKKEGKQPIKYIELDFQEVTYQKVNITRSTEALAALLDKESEVVEEDRPLGRLVTSDYCVLPADLRDLDAVEQALTDAGLDKKMPTLVLAECVLVYLDARDSSRIVEYFGHILPNAVFLVYEQIRPEDAFGRQMVKNLEARGCPLRGLPSTPSLVAHEERFREHGWKKAMAWDMDTIYKTIIPYEEHKRLELFDEFEEWHMIQEHYCICIGVNDSKGVLKGYGFKELQSRSQ